MNLNRYGALVVVLALVGAACGSDDAVDSEAAGESTTTEALTTTAAAEDAGVGIALASTDLGDIMVDGDGNTMYLFVQTPRATAPVTSNVRPPGPSWQR